MSPRLLAATLVLMIPVTASASPICHTTGKGWQQLDVPAPAAAAHMKHGDHVPTSWYLDADGDGFGDPNDAIVSCSDLPGYVANGNDLNDEDPATGPCLDVTGGWSTTVTDASGPHDLGVASLIGTTCSFTGRDIVGTGYGWSFTVQASMPDGPATCYGTVVSSARLDMACPTSTFVLTR